MKKILGSEKIHLVYSQQRLVSILIICEFWYDTSSNITCKRAQLGTILSFMMGVTTLLPSMIMLRKAIESQLLENFYCNMCSWNNYCYLDISLMQFRVSTGLEKEKGD